MSPSAADIETIVRRVLRALTSDAAPEAAGSISPDTVSTLRLSERVISMQLVRDKLSNQQAIEIGRMSVITPAAKDYCRERKIAIVRLGEANTSAPALIQNGTTKALESPKPQRLFVAGTASWMPSIAKQLCNRQSQVEAMQADDTSAMHKISEGLRTGHQAGLAVVSAPHAACWQAARDDRLRPAVVSNWAELSNVLREVPVNVLILSSKNWNVASTCNVARRFFEHLRSNS
jgi:hypothetical protein